MKKNFFNYREMGQKVLLTNDLGRYLFLSREEFYRFLRDRLDPQEEITQRLVDEFFLYDGSEYEFVERAGEAFRMYRRNLFQGAALHILWQQSFSHWTTSALLHPVPEGILLQSVPEAFL